VSLLLSPHDDDSCLFAAFTCLRERPDVVIIADSFLQTIRGEVGCSSEERASETKAAHEILGCRIVRCGLRDDNLVFDQVTDALSKLFCDGCVYTPALESGHPHHDMVTLAAVKVFGAERLRCYSTYSRHSRYCGTDLHPVGTTHIEWTRPELALKERALACYESQLRVNAQHFEAVKGRGEWISGYNRLHLGCGEQEKRGWLNVDRVRPSWAGPFNPFFIQADFAADRIPAGDNSIDYLFSEDVLEHLPADRRVQILNECWRVLVPGGVMEHYIPNAGSQNDFGSLSHLSHWNLQCFDHVDIESKRWQSDHAFEGFVGGFTKVKAELLNWQVEEDGVKRAQCFHVIYRAVK